MFSGTRLRIWCGQIKGQPREGLPFFHPQGGRSAKTPGLGEVVAEGGEHHVVDALGGDGGTAGWHTA
jgi:hypothetical protein